MAALDLNDLKYGIIYVIGNPKQTSNLRWFGTMIEPMIRPLSLEWVETWDHDHTMIVARRFNVGNIGKYATVQLHLNQYGNSDSFSLLAGVHAFSDCLQDVMDNSEGDVLINESDYANRNQSPQGKWGSSTSSAPISDVLSEHGFDISDRMTANEAMRHYDIEALPDHTRVVLPQSPRPVESSPSVMAPEEGHEEKKSLKKRINRIRKKFSKSNKSRYQEIDRDSDSWPDEVCFEDRPDEVWTSRDKDIVPTRGGKEATPDVMDIEAEEVVEFKRIESEYERDVNDLRARIVAFIAKYHQDPRQIMTTLLEGKVLLGTTPGHVLVNGDMKIVLPEYDEMEIKMPAMCRTLYILFMKQRKQGGGIVLRDIEKYRDDIIDIYSMVKPGANEQRIEQTVNNLCDPFGESLNQMISRINRCIKNVITDKELANRYVISGTRGEEYSIDLDPELLTLPRAVTMN